LLFGKAAPGGHAVRDGTCGDKPEDFAIRRGLRGTLRKNGDVAASLPCSSMTTRTARRVKLCASRDSRRLASEGVLLVRSRGGCVVKMSVLCRSKNRGGTNCRYKKIRAIPEVQIILQRIYCSSRPANQLTTADETPATRAPASGTERKPGSSLQLKRHAMRNASANRRDVGTLTCHDFCHATSDLFCQR